MILFLFIGGGAKGKKTRGEGKKWLDGNRRLTVLLTACVIELGGGGWVVDPLLLSQLVIGIHSRNMITCLLRTMARLSSMRW